MSDAKAFLQQVKLYDTHINVKLEELSRIKALTTKITPTLKQDVVSGSGNQDKLGDAVAKIVDLEREINAIIDAYIKLKRQVNDVVDKVTDPDQAAVLYKRYFLYERWEQIALEMNMTYRNVCYIHGKALLTIKKLLESESFHIVS